MINPKTDTAQDEQDIRKLKEVFATGFLKKDAKLRASIWTEDGTVAPPTGGLFQGRDAMEKHFETEAASVTDSSRMSFSNFRFRFITAEGFLAELRRRRSEVAAFLRARLVIPAMPPGIRLVAWRLKEPPVAIETCAVVTDSVLFARATLEQLRKALSQPKRWVGWSVPQLIDRLAQVGVAVALESPGEVSCNEKRDE